MSTIIEFPIKKKGNVTLDDIHKNLDALPTNETITNYMIIAISNDGKILTCFNGDDSTRALGGLEVLKSHIIKNMNKEN